MKAILKPAQVFIGLLAACGLCCALPLIMGAGLIPAVALAIGSHSGSALIGLLTVVVGTALYLKTRKNKKICEIKKKSYQ